MNVGHLFVLFGLDVQDKTFRHGLHQLAAVHMAASSAIGAIVDLGKGVFHLTHKLGEEATHIHSLSQAMGMNIEQAQRWSYVAEQSGSNIKELSIGVSMLQGNLRKLAVGDASTRLRSSFAALKITAADARESMKGPDGLEHVMMIMSDRFKQLGVSGEASTLARYALGARAGRALQADMIRGSETLKQMFKRADDIGAIISGEDVVTLQNSVFDMLNDVERAFKGTMSTALAQIAPAIKDVLNDLALWFGRNKDLIGVVLKELVMHLIFAFKVLMKIVDALGWLIRGVMNGDTGAIALFSLMAAGIIMIATLIVTVLLPTITLIGGALFAAMLPLLPWTILLALIIALGIIIYKNWETYGEFFSLIWDTIKEDASSFWNWLTGTVDTVGDGISTALDNLRDGWSEFWDDVEDLASRALDAVVGGVLQGVNMVVKALNFIPGVNLGHVDMPEWAKHVPKKAVAGAVSGTAMDTSTNVKATDEALANAPRVSMGAATGAGAGARNVNVAPTTVNIYGVKDAKEASGHITNAIDNQNRHAAAALAGEVQ